MTNVFSSCQTNNFAKQMFTRTTSMSGLSEVIFTVGAAYFRNSMSSGDSELYNAIDTFKTSTDCGTSSRNLGILLKNVMNMETPDEVYYEDLGQDLKDEFID